MKELFILIQKDVHRVLKKLKVFKKLKNSENSKYLMCVFFFEKNEKDNLFT